MDEVAVDGMGRSPVVGDGGRYHASARRPRLEDSDRYAGAGEEGGGGEPAWATSDHRDFPRGEVWGDGSCRWSLVVGDVAFDLTDRQRLIHVGPQADRFARMMTGSPEDRGQWVVEARDLGGAVIVAGSHPPHIFGDFLIDITAIGTRSDDAVEKTEMARGLGVAAFEGLLVVRGRRENRIGVLAKIGAGNVHCRLIIVRDPGTDEGFDALGVDSIHGAFKLVQILAESQIPTGPQEVRADRDGFHAGADQRRHVVGVRTTRKRHHQRVLDVLGKTVGELDGESVQRATREVHRFL